MNNKTLKRVVAFLATALLVCSCAFAAEILNTEETAVSYDATSGEIVVPFAPGTGATKAALLVRNERTDEIVALAQFNSLNGGEVFEETIDTEKVAAGDKLLISVGDNAATSTSAATAEYTVSVPVVKYTVTYGETVTEYEAGTAIADVLPTDVPTKEATEQYTYTFAGWLVNGVAPVEGAKLEGNIEITAAFTETAREYTVVFYDEDGVTVLSEQKLTYGETPVEPEAPAKEGFTFKGWDKDIVAVTGDATYKATYEATPIIPDVETFTVIFMNGATEVSKVEEVAAGTALSTLVPAEPTKAKNTFIGWYLDETFATKMADNTVAADTTLYAKFSLTGLYGDANADGVVNNRDFTEIMGKLRNASYAGKAGTAMADCQTAAGKAGLFGDANADGVVNNRDFTEIMGKLRNASYAGKAGTAMVMVKD